MALTESVGAQTGAPERLARMLTAPPGAHSSSSAPVHPSGRPRELANPAQPPAQGDGGLQHAPVLRESTMALTESVGSLISSVPLPWQYEDRGRKAAESLAPVPGSLKFPLRAIARPLVVARGLDRPMRPPAILRH
jgi:hypothetical protein